MDRIEKRWLKDRCVKVNISGASYLETSLFPESETEFRAILDVAKAADAFASLIKQGQNGWKLPNNQSCQDHITALMLALDDAKKLK